MSLAGVGEDRAVSELTSALALVGVTLLLVAAIGSSVVFLEERDSGPSGQFSFDYRGDSQRLLVTYEGGDAFEAGNVSIQGPNDASARWSELTGAEPSATIEQSDVAPIGEGGAYGQSVGSEDSIRVVYIDPKAGSATVRAEAPDSGLAETVDVELVRSFADVFDTSGEIDPPISDDGTATDGTVFEAVLENGSNREFTLGPDDVTFCNGGEKIQIGTSGLPEDAVIAAGDRIGLSVKITVDRPDNGFALVVASGDPNVDGREFKIIHEFTPDAEDCS